MAVLNVDLPYLLGVKEAEAKGVRSLTDRAPDPFAPSAPRRAANKHPPLNALCTPPPPVRMPAA